MKKYLPHVFLLMIAALPSLAAIIGPLPVTLTNGTTADANQVMSDFNKILNDVNANASPLATTPQLNLSNTFTFPQTGPNATQAGNYVNAGQIQQQGVTYFADTGTTNALVATPIPAWTSYQAGQTITLNIKNTNTGGTTLSVSALGAKNVLMPDLSPLYASAVIVSQVATFEYDGTQFQLASLNRDGSTVAFNTSNTKYATNAYALSAVQTQGANIASASSINLATATGDYAQITGTTAISGVVMAQGMQRTVEFQGSLQLTPSTNLVLPTTSAITTTAGDTAIFRGEAAGVARMVGGNIYSGILGNSMVFITTATASNAATLDVFWTAAQASAYDQIEFVYTGINVFTNNTTLNIRVSTDGSTFDSGAANYQWSNYTSTASATSAASGSGSTSLMQVIPGMNSTVATSSGNIDGFLYQPSNTTFSKLISGKSVMVTSGSGVNNADFSGTYIPTTALRGLRLIAGTGNVTGTVYIYGRKKY